MAFSQIIARLGVSLGLDTASFETGSRKAQKEVTGLRSHVQKAAGAITTALAGMVSWEVVAQLRDMTRAAVDAAGGLGEEAAALGVTTTQLQEYRYAATQVGLSQAEMDKGLEQLTRRLGDAAQGVKEPALALERLGISLDDVRGKTAGEVIPMIADGMAKIEDPTQRAAIAVDLFGRAGQKLATLLQGGAAEVDNLRQAAHDLGIVLSESDIAKADEIADKVAALRFVLEAQQNKKLLENADALLEYETAVGELKLGLINASNTLDNWADEFDAFNARNAAVMRGRWKQVGENFVTIGRDIAGAAEFIKNTIGNMVTGVGNWISGRLNAIWDGAKAKIDQVKGWFFGLYDAVIGHSYIPDMVDGIRDQMARLDAVMVAPVSAATTKAEEAFREMASRTRSILARLFPEVEEQLQYERDLADLRASGAGDEAEKRLNRERLGIPLEGGLGRPADGFFVDSLDDGTRKFEDGLKSLAERAEATTVRVAKSFKDMADQTLQSLSNLSSAIKGGGFLSILEALVGFGVQLGSIGVFGKTVASRLNATRGYATGTASAARGLALVGERGPELVNFRGGERVYNNRDTMGMMGGGQLEIRPSPLFEVYLDGKLVQAAPAIATAGAQGGVALMNRKASRRWR